MYQFQSRIRYSELNKDKLLGVDSLLDYFQDCSTFQSEEIGRGMEYLEGRNLAWLMNYWQVVFNRFPTLGENVTIGTWPYAFDRLFGYRNYLMLGEGGDVLACANTVWFLMDMVKQHPVRTDEKILAAYPMEDKYTMDYAPRKINVPGDMPLVDTFTVKPGHLDTNQHVNNVSYIRMALDYLPDDFTPWQLRASYQNSALLGDAVSVRTKSTDEGYYILLCDKEGAPYTTVEFKTKG